MATDAHKRCLMLVDTPIRADRRVRACIEAYEAQGVAVDVVNVKWVPISARDWARAAPMVAWFVTVFTIRWYITALLRLPRYRYLWRTRDLARYRLRALNLPVIFWYETSAHLARGVAWARANRTTWAEVDFIHAHDLATLSFAQYFMTDRKGMRLTYDAHELSAFRNRPGLSWLSGLLITAFETTGIRRSATHVISVSPFILTYMRFFAGKVATFRLVVNDFYEANPIVREDAPGGVGEDGPDNGRFAIVYIGSIIRGRGLARLVKSFENTPECQLFFYSPEDNPRQRGFGKAYEGALKVTVRYGPYDETIARDVAPFARVYGWIGVEDICLSYRYALPNKVFQYLKFGVSLISNEAIYAFEFLAKGVSGKSKKKVLPKRLALPETVRQGGYYAMDIGTIRSLDFMLGYRACVGAVCLDQ